MTNYNIIGGDGRQYGPITGDELRKWVAQGRLNAKSRAQAVGTSDWLPLENFPEFAEVLGINPVVPPPIALPTNPEAYSKEILTRAPDLGVGECISAGFKFLSANAGFVIGAVFVSWFVIAAMRFVPLFGGILTLIFGGVITGGLYLACLRQMRGEEVSVGNIFDGFKLCLIQLILAGAISRILSQIGLLFCFLPGIYLMIAWVFALPLVADKRLEFWSAMELSRKVVTRVWFQVALIVLLIFLPFVLAQIVMGVKIGGFLYATFRDVNFDFERWINSATQHVQTIVTMSLLWGFVSQVVYLLCQFVAVGALMRAYENLFGERQR